jgi:ATP-dependent exoDNAse (exonuclease V) beta subunit
MFAARADRTAYESLCLLYVALTRAVHAVEMVIAPPSKPEEYSATLAGLLRAALAPGTPAAPDSVLYDSGDPAWERKAAPAAAVAKAGAVSSATEIASPVIEEVRIGLAPSRGPRRRGLDRRSPSQLEGGPRVDLRRRLQVGESTGRTQGTLIHGWFQQIAWLEEGLPDDAALRKSVNATDVSEADLAARLARFRAMVARPAVVRTLSRSSYDDPAALGFSGPIAKELVAGLAGNNIRLELHRERLFALRLDDAIVQGSFDRLLLFRQGTKVVAADILDFKTDRVVDSSGISERVKIYQPQLEEYRRAAAALFGLNPQRVTARLLFVEPGELRDCPRSNH